jgi:hypothetical protein
MEVWTYERPYFHPSPLFLKVALRVEQAELAGGRQQDDQDLDVLLPALGEG